MSQTARKGHSCQDVVNQASFGLLASFEPQEGEDQPFSLFESLKNVLEFEGGSHASLLDDFKGRRLPCISLVRFQREKALIHPSCTIGSFKRIIVKSTLLTPKSFSSPIKGETTSCKHNLEINVSETLPNYNLTFFKFTQVVFYKDLSQIFTGKLV